MLKMSWSFERMLVLGCVAGFFVIIPIASLLNHHKAPPTVASSAAGGSEETAVPDESDVPQILNVGSKAPAFESTTVDGQSFSSSSLGGHVAILDFWATWCGPCQMAIPSLQDIHTKYAAKGVRVIGVSMDTDTASSVKPYIAHMKMTYPVLLDPNRNSMAAGRYEAYGLPSIYVLDKYGDVQWSTSGYFPGEESVITQVVDRLLKEH